MKLDEIYLNDILIWNLELSEQVEYINLLVDEKKRFKNIIFNLYINDYSNQMLEKSIDINNEKIENASYRKVIYENEEKILKAVIKSFSNNCDFELLYSILESNNFTRKWQTLKLLYKLRGLKNKKALYSCYKNEESQFLKSEYIRVFIKHNLNYNQVVSFAKKELQEVEFLLDTTDYKSKKYESYDYCGQLLEFLTKHLTENQLFQFLLKSNDPTLTKIIINGLEKFHMKDIENIQNLINILDIKLKHTLSQNDYLDIKSLQNLLIEKIKYWNYYLQTLYELNLGN